jgi:hypothetical protein
MWEPRRLTALWAFTACYRESFTFFNLISVIFVPFISFILSSFLHLKLPCCHPFVLRVKVAAVCIVMLYRARRDQLGVWARGIQPQSPWGPRGAESGRWRRMTPSLLFKESSFRWAQTSHWSPHAKNKLTIWNISILQCSGNFVYRAGLVARMGKTKNAYKLLLRKSEKVQTVWKT